MLVQINGKTKTEINSVSNSVECAKKTIENQIDMSKYRIVHVPNRLINFVSTTNPESNFN